MGANEEKMGKTAEAFRPLLPLHTFQSLALVSYISAYPSKHAVTVRKVGAIMALQEIHTKQMHIAV